MRGCAQSVAGRNGATMVYSHCGLVFIGQIAACSLAPRPHGILLTRDSSPWSPPRLARVPCGRQHMPLQLLAPRAELRMSKDNGDIRSARIRTKPEYRTGIYSVLVNLNR
jgi:hypothetical protein